MHDEQWSSSKVTAAAVWTWTAGLMGCAWVAWFLFAFDLKHLPDMFGYTACASSAVAAVASIKCYTVRICRLLRITAGLEPADDSERPRPIYPVR